MARSEYFLILSKRRRFTQQIFRGISTGFGGPPACWLIKEHFARFVIGSDPRDTNRIWDQLFRASMFYGRKGITLAAISVVDLAIWDLLGKLRNEPIYVYFFFPAW